MYEAYNRRCLVGSSAYVSRAEKKGCKEKIWTWEPFAYTWYSKLRVLMTWSRKKVKNEKIRSQD